MRTTYHCEGCGEDVTAGMVYHGAHYWQRRDGDWDTCGPVWRSSELLEALNTLPTEEMSEGARRIAAERKIHEKKWSPEHDDAHPDGSLSVFAAALAVEGTDAHVEDMAGRIGEGYREDDWGLLAKYGDDRIRCLEIAGALIAAEIDRELRLRGLR